MTAKQAAFCMEYAKDFDATKAAKRAGYSEKTAGQLGYQLLQKTSIQHEIKRLLKERVMSRDEALSRLSDQARSNIGDFIEIHEKDYGCPNEPLVTVDLAKARDRGKLALVQAYKHGRYGPELKLYSAQVALMKILDEYARVESGEQQNEALDRFFDSMKVYDVDGTGPHE